MDVSIRGEPQASCLHLNFMPNGYYALKKIKAFNGH